MQMYLFVYSFNYFLHPSIWRGFCFTAVCLFVCLFVIFAHNRYTVARFDDDIPANKPVHLHVKIFFSLSPDRKWRCPPGRPWNKCLDQFRDDSARLKETCGGVQSAAVQRRDGTRRLRDRNDDGDIPSTATATVIGIIRQYPCRPTCSGVYEFQGPRVPAVMSV